MNFTSSRKRSLPVFGAILVVAALAACSDLSRPEPVVRRFGSLVVEGKSISPTEVRATAKAIFFESATASVPSSITAQNDQCTTTLVDTTTVDVTGQNRAGEALALQVGTETFPMAWVPFFARYQTATADTFTYTAGTTAQVTVPGEATTFPASSVSVLLAEPLLVPEVVVPATGPLVINWNASTTTTSAILLSLRYADPSTAGYGNRQIVCQLRDDGNLEIASANLAAFRASPFVHRSLTLTRFRTSEIQLDNRTLLHISSQVDTTAVLR